MADELSPDPDSSRLPHRYRPVSEDITHTPVGARVPEKIGRGAFCTASIVLQTGEVFVLDFLSTMAPPHQVAARIVMPVLTFSQFVTALKTNVALYEEKFGKLAARIQSRRPPQATGNPSPVAEVSHTELPAVAEGAKETAGRSHDEPQPIRIADLYEQLKLADELLGGAFASVVMIRHTSEEFCFDFITNFYPRSAVTSRIFLAAGRIPSLLETMTDSLSKYHRKLDSQRGGDDPESSAP